MVVLFSPQRQYIVEARDMREVYDINMILLFMSQLSPSLLL